MLNQLRNQFCNQRNQFYKFCSVTKFNECVYVKKNLLLLLFF